MYASALIFVISVTFFMVYHDFIAPLFDKFVPLPAGTLREQIEALATELEFPLKKLEVVMGSKRSSHSNAYFYGFGSNKRIVLFDTLLEKSIRPVDEEAEAEAEAEKAKADGKADVDSEGKDEKGCKPEEISAVLSHELGHWSYNHVAKNFAAGQLQMLLLFFLFQQILDYPALFTDFGFPGEDRPVLVGMLIVFSYILAPLQFVLSAVTTWNTRRFEFQADAFANNLGRGKPLVRALVKLNNDNKGFPVYDSLYSAFHNTHPPLLERIEAIELAAKKN